MKGFNVEVRPRPELNPFQTPQPFEKAIFITTRDVAEEWMKINIDHSMIESRLMPGMAVAKDLVSSEFVIQTAH